MSEMNVVIMVALLVWSAWNVFRAARWRQRTISGLGELAVRHMEYAAEDAERGAPRTSERNKAKSEALMDAATRVSARFWE